MGWREKPCIWTNTIKRRYLNFTHNSHSNRCIWCLSVFTTQYIFLYPGIMYARHSHPNLGILDKMNQNSHFIRWQWTGISGLHKSLFLLYIFCQNQVFPWISFLLCLWSAYQLPSNLDQYFCYTLVFPKSLLVPVNL